MINSFINVMAAASNNPYPETPGDYDPSLFAIIHQKDIVSIVNQVSVSVFTENPTSL